jgi:hypothetical protein
MAETVTALDRNEIQPVPQGDREKDNQYFVMHEQLKTLAQRCLKKCSAQNGRWDSMANPAMRPAAK